MEYLIGLALGILLGLAGSGGTVFAVPLIMLCFHTSSSDAMGLALGVVALSAVYGVVNERKHVFFIPGLMLGVSGIFAAPLGRVAATHLSDTWLLVGFSLLALLSAFSMWRKSCPSRLVNAEPLADLTDKEVIDIARKHSPGAHLFNAERRVQTTRMIVGGLGIGFISGLLGVGGGVLIVPFLQHATRLPVRAVLMTSLFVIALVSSSGFITSLYIDRLLDLTLFLKLSCAGIVGVALSQRIGVHLSDGVSQKLFAVLLILLTALTIFPLATSSRAYSPASFPAAIHSQ